MKKRNLPNFKFLRKLGVLGVLESCHPPTTIPAWPCMFTGKNPGKLGAFHFQELDKERGRFVPFDLSRLYGKFIWDSGISTTLGFVPGITPPYPINGRILEGPPGPKDFRTYPEELKGKIIGGKSISILKKAYPSVLQRIMSYFRVRRDLIHYLVEKYQQELLITVYRPTDDIIHGGTGKEDFYEIYEKMDKELGYFLEKTDEEEASLFVVSDHGANKAKRGFFMNTWLEQQGYLRLTKSGRSVKDSLIRKIINKLRELPRELPGNAPSFDTFPLFRKIRKMMKNLIKTEFKARKQYVSEQIEWEQSKAVAYLIGALPVIGVALNEKQLSMKEIETIKEEIVTKLEREAAVKWAKLREELYFGDKVDDLPHIIVRGEGDVVMRCLINPKTYMRLNMYGHGYEGVFGAYGPNINHLEDFKTHIFDIAPTVLHALGREIPQDMDGKVLEDIFKAKREVKYGKPIDKEIELKKPKTREEEIKERLEELGYIAE